MLPLAFMHAGGRKIKHNPQYSKNATASVAPALVQNGFGGSEQSTYAPFFCDFVNFSSTILNLALRRGTCPRTHTGQKQHVRIRILRFWMHFFMVRAILRSGTKNARRGTQFWRSTSNVLHPEVACARRTSSRRKAAPPRRPWWR